MKYMVIGAHRETGDDVEMVIEARTPALAQEAANRNGIMVARVAPAFTQMPPPQLQQGHVAHAPVINVALPRRGSSLGVASMVLGVIAFLICWIPFLNLLGLPLAAVGLLLGLVGILVAITRQGSGIGLPIAGSLLCGMSLGAVVLFAGTIIAGIVGLGNAIDEAAKEQDRTNQTIVESVITPDDPQSPESAAAVPAPMPAHPSVPVTTKPASVVNDPPEEEWATASKPVSQGDVQIRIVSVRVNKVPLEGGSGSESADDLLMIAIAIENKSETRKVDYRSWSNRNLGSFRDAPELEDNFDNRYARANFGYLSRPVGSVVMAESVYPGTSVNDLLVFEKPIDKAEYLNLVLPAENFGGTGKLRIRIPESMIKR